MTVYRAIGRFRDQYLLFWIHSLGFMVRFNVFASSCRASVYFFSFDDFALDFALVSVWLAEVANDVERQCVLLALLHATSL